jgi:indolepyruvate ferredoxin oxidoreductase, beta subunit
MVEEVTNVLLCGTGGQGILLASEILSGAAMLSGLDVKKSEVHGMSQRGGSVVSHVRFGPRVHSPVVEEGTAHLVLALEKLEALRWAHFLRRDGQVLVCDLEIMPLTVNAGLAEYPDVYPALDAMGIRWKSLKAMDEAAAMGDLRVVNTLLMGAASSFLPLCEDCWVKALTNRLPSKALEINLKAFRRGRELAAE